MKPRIFIGSSSENKEIAEAISFNLDDISYPEVWDQSLSTLSQSTLTNLINAIETFEYAIFVFGDEDTAIIRNDNVSIVRDNVIFETGLFMGKLGVDHVFFVKPKSKEIHMPSDLLGINYGVYDIEHPNKQAALRPFCKQVKDQIAKNYKPDFPSDGIYGENLLSKELVNILGNINIGDTRHEYGLYANTSPTQKLIIKITNLSSDIYNNVWYINFGEEHGWSKSVYSGSQDFVLPPETKGYLKIRFAGHGSANIQAFLNDNPQPILEKFIYWKN